MKKIVIYGSGDYGQILKQLVLDNDFKFLGYIDDFNTGPEILSTYNDAVDWLIQEKIGVVLGIGYKYIKERLKIAGEMISRGIELPTLISSSAFVHKTSCVEDWVVIMPNTTVDMRTRIGFCSVLWPAAVVNHDSVIGQGTFVSSGAIICGRCNIGSSVFIGAGSVIVEEARVPDEFSISAHWLVK